MDGIEVARRISLFLMIFATGININSALRLRRARKRMDKYMVSLCTNKVFTWTMLKQREKLEEKQMVYPGHFEVDRDDVRQTAAFICGELQTLEELKELMIGD